MPDEYVSHVRFPGEKIFGTIVVLAAAAVVVLAFIVEIYYKLNPSIAM